MIFFIFLISIYLATPVIGEGRLEIVQTTNDVNFISTTSQLFLSEIPQIIFSIFGFPEVQFKWNGLVEGNLFKRPSTIALFQVVLPKQVIQCPDCYKVAQDVAEINMNFLERQLETPNWNQKPLIIETSVRNMLIDIKSNFESLSSSYLLDEPTLKWVSSKSLFTDLNREMEAVEKITLKLLQNKTSETRAAPELLLFKFSSLIPLLDSSHYEEALAILKEFISKVTNELNSLHDKKIVSLTTFIDSSSFDSLKFEARKLKASNSTTPSNLNRAPRYTSMFPVIFNIVLWFGVTITIAFIWIAWSIWHMDPGKDSVIYRMTTQRLKRD